MAGKLQVRWRLGVRCGVRAGARAAVGWLVGCLDGRCVSSVSETGPDTPVYPVYLTVTKLLLMRCVSSVSEAGADTQCIWCIWGPQPVYLPSRDSVNRPSELPVGIPRPGGVWVTGTHGTLQEMEWGEKNNLQSESSSLSLIHI